jgi:hypothetical protein
MAYIVVYSPDSHHARWRVIQYQVTSTASDASQAVQVLRQRLLTPQEVAYFEGMIAG